MTRAPRQLLRLVSVGLTLILVVPLASAAPSTSARQHRVEVSAAGCGRAELEIERVTELLRVELSAFDVEVVAEHSSPPRPATEESRAEQATSRLTLIAEPCEASPMEVVVRVEQATFSGPAARRRVEISDVAFANRARTLAIAAAELLQTAWSTPGPAPASAPPASPPTPTAPPEGTTKPAPKLTRRSRLESPTPGVWLEAGVLARTFPSGGTALLGPELSLSLPLGSVLTLALSGEVSSGVASLAFNDANGAVASVTANTATFNIGPGLRSRGPVALEVGPRVGLGNGRLANRYGGASANGALVFVSFEALLRAQLLAGWASFAGIEVGRALSRVALESGETPLTFNSVELDGVLIGARIGLSFALTHRP